MSASRVRCQCVRTPHVSRGRKVVGQRDPLQERLHGRTVCATIGASLAALPGSRDPSSASGGCTTSCRRLRGCRKRRVPAGRTQADPEASSHPIDIDRVGSRKIARPAVDPPAVVDDHAERRRRPRRFRRRSIEVRVTKLHDDGVEWQRSRHAVRQRYDILHREWPRPLAGQPAHRRHAGERRVLSQEGREVRWARYSTWPAGSSLRPLVHERISHHNMHSRGCAGCSRTPWMAMHRGFERARRRSRHALRGSNIVKER